MKMYLLSEQSLTQLESFMQLLHDEPKIKDAILSTPWGLSRASWADLALAGCRRSPVGDQWPVQIAAGIKPQWN